MEQFLTLVLEPLKNVYSRFADFFPNLLAMLIIILIGIFAARIIRKLVLNLFKAIRFDSWSDRMGLTSMMRKGDLWAKPSSAVAAFIFWLLVLVSVLAGFSALKIQLVDNLISQFVVYIPRVLSAVLILIFGAIAAGLIGRTVLISAVNSGYPFAKQLAEIVRLLLLVLIIAMALEQLQVAPGIVVAAFSILFGGIVLALAIAFGTGGIDAAKRIIKGEEEKKEERRHDIEHL